MLVPAFLCALDTGALLQVQRLGFEITECDLKAAHSVAVSWNMKSSGNRAKLRLTAGARVRVSTS